MKSIRVLSILVLLGACSPLDILKSKPMVNTNAQVGKENSQVVGSNTRYGEQKLSSHASKAEQSQGQVNKLKTDSVETVIINETPVWVIIALVVGFLLPSPNEIARMIWESRLWRKTQD
jgi:4-amino-4-deoxy-L-arabinose transferase-like glycosyltransferase